MRERTELEELKLYVEHDCSNTNCRENRNDNPAINIPHEILYRNVNIPCRYRITCIDMFVRCQPNVRHKPLQLHQTPCMLVSGNANRITSVMAYVSLAKGVLAISTIRMEEPSGQLGIVE